MRPGGSCVVRLTSASRPTAVASGRQQHLERQSLRAQKRGPRASKNLQRARPSLCDVEWCEAATCRGGKADTVMGTTSAPACRLCHARIKETSVDFDMTPPCEGNVRTDHLDARAHG